METTGRRTFTVVIDRVRWGNEDATIFTGHDEAAPFVQLTVKMQAAGRVGQRWIVRGHEVMHPKFGPQFDAVFAVRARPRTDGELSQYLIDLGWDWRTADAAISHLERLA